MNVITIYTNKFLEFSFQRTLFFIHIKVNKCKKTIKNVGVLHKNDTKMLKYRLKIAKMGGNINIKKMIDKIIMTKK